MLRPYCFWSSFSPRDSSHRPPLHLRDRGGRSRRPLRRGHGARPPRRRHLGSPGRGADAPHRRRFAAGRALHRRVHRRRPRAPGLLYLHRCRAAVLRRHARRQNDDARAWPGPDGPRTGWPCRRQHGRRARHDEGDGAGRRARNPGLRSAELSRGPPRPGGDADVSRHRGIRNRGRHHHRLADEPRAARPLHTRFHQGIEALLSVQGRLVRAAEERELRVHDRARGVHRWAIHAGRGGGRGAQHDTHRRLLGHSHPRARRLLGGGAAVIEFQDLYKGFDGNAVLQGLSLKIGDAETVVIIGYSGTGKSVALKHIVGLLQPDAGDVIVDGQAVSTLDRDGLTELRQGIGYVFQFAALFDSLTVADNLALGLRRRALSDEEIEDRVREALALVDLSGTGERMPAELSGGMRKRVGIARAIALRPRYILYDEPTTGLDPVTSAVIDRLMVRTREHLGVTGVVVTHDMRSAYTVGDRIAMLYEGRVRQVGSVAEIQQTEDPVVRQFIEGRAE